MNAATRFTILISCFSFCAGGAVLSHHASATGAEPIASDPVNFANGYEQIASGRRHEPSFNEIESLIRHHKTARAYHGRIEFGSVKMEGAMAVVQVLFFAPDGSMSPFSYTLTETNDAWKVESVQRIWFVPRARLLRGLRV